MNLTYIHQDKKLDNSTWLKSKISNCLYFWYIRKLYSSHSCNNLIEPEVGKLFVGVKVAIHKYIFHHQRKI